MSAPTYVPGLSIPDAQVFQPPRHSLVVRITHWIHACTFLALVISGIAILLAHTRFYWGETGAEGATPLIVLPLRLHRESVSGWGRNLHFLAAWICVLNGLLYVVFGFVSQHFRKDLVPAKAELSRSSIARLVWDHVRLKRPTDGAYNVLQRVAYLSVVFVFFPMITLSGLAMSPTITAGLPGLVGVFGGQQSARTIHFLLANLLMIFLFVHLGMVWLAGFSTRVRAMIMGGGTRRAHDE